MGVVQSLPVKFCIDNTDYKAHINSIETESVQRVYNKLMEEKFTALNQMLTVCTLIYEKAISKPELSLKCAHLVKELANEGYIEDGQEYYFQTTFDRYFLDTIHSYIKNYNDSKLNSESIRIIVNVAKFLGNLFITEIYQIRAIIEIAKLAKKHGTPRTFFFMENLLSVICVKLLEVGITREIFEDFVDNREFPEKHRPGSKDCFLQVQSQYFLEYLRIIRETNYYDNFDYAEGFESYPKNIYDLLLSAVVDDIIKSPENLAIYRDILLAIHFFKPKNFKTTVKNKFTKAIDFYEVTKSASSKKNLENFAHLGDVILKLYNLRLINNDILEHFLDTAKLPKLKGNVFRVTFLEVLQKYQGKKLMDYVAHLKNICSTNTEFNVVSLIIEDYVNHLDERKLMEEEKNKFSTANAIALPDFYEHWCLDIKNTKPFDCSNRPSCHLAAARSIEIMTAHIGNKFFTAERIGILTKMTKKWTKISNQDRISENIEDEIKIYLPYIQNDIEPTLKLKKFTNLVVAFYNEGLIKITVIKNWMNELLQIVYEKKHEFHEKYLEIYLPAIEKVINNFMHDDIELWIAHYNFLSLYDKINSKFDDYENLMKIIKLVHHHTNNFQKEFLRNLTIPNNKFAMRYISGILIQLYIEENFCETYASSVFAVFFDQFSSTADKTLFRSVFQNALSQRLGFMCAACEGTGTVNYAEALQLINLIEFMCRQTQITRLGLANMFFSMARMIDVEKAAVLKLMKLATNKFSQCLIGASPLPATVEKIVVKIIEQIESADPKANDLLNVFKNILDDSNKKKMTK